MMKKVIALLVSLSLLLTGCSIGRQSGAENTVRFYYKTAGLAELQSSESVAVENRELTPFSLAGFLNAYFSGPEDEKLESPFPTGTRVLDIEENGKTITLTMSTAYFALQGIDLSIADCCLVKTVCDYTGADSVILVDETGQIRLELNPESYETERGADDETTASYTLYFPNQDETFLVAESMSLNFSENESVEELLLRELISGPNTGSLHSVIPDGTDLISAETTDGICTVDLSKEFLENRPEDDYEDFLILYSIVNTLTILDDVSSVQFKIDGEKEESYGIFLIDQPLSRYGQIIESVSSNTELITDVFLRSISTGEIFALKVSAAGSGRASVAETILRTMLSFEPPQGFETVIPYGTELISVSVSGETCFIDLSDEFIPQNDTEEAEYQELYAIVNAMTGLDGINGVQLTIEEETTGLSWYSLEQRLTAESLKPITAEE